jgi:hypothetical protein
VKTSVDIQGQAETEAAFKDLATRVENDAEAATKVASLVAGKASQFAPVRTGLMAGSYGVQDRYVVNVAPYAGFVEYGVPSLEMAPQNTVQRAFEASSEQIEKVYSQWIAREASAVGLESNSG